MSASFTPFGAATQPARAGGFAPRLQAAETAAVAEMSVPPVRRARFQSVRSPSHAEEAARQAGYSAGYAAGWAAAAREEAELVEARIQQRTEVEHQAVARLDDLRSALVLARESARALTSPQLQASAEELMLAAAVLAEDLVGVVLADPRHRVSAAVARAVEIEEDAGIVRVRMHPDDIATYHEMAADHTCALSLPEGVDLVADPSLRPGDALTELEDGFLDARLSSAIGRVREELAAAVPDDEVSRMLETLGIR